MRENMKRIAAVTYGLNYGGVERVCLDYVRLLQTNGHEVDLYVLNPNEVEMACEIPNGVSLKKVKLPPLLCPESYWRLAVKFSWGKYLFPLFYIFFYLLIHVYKTFVSSSKKYDVAIAFGGHINDLSFVAYNFVKAEKKVAWLHGGLYTYMIIAPCYQFLYKKIRNLVVLTDLVQNECLFFNKQLKLNIKKIYNPSFIATREVDNKEVCRIKDKYGDFILMVARVDLPKNHIGLIKAMEFLYKKYGFKHNLVFVGEGPLREELQKYAATTAISDCIYFAGNQASPQNYYAAAKLFVLSSISEGLPTVLIEAAYFGLPLVSSDASVKEILGSNDYGLIAPIKDDEALGEHIYRLLTNSNDFDYYSQKAKSRYSQFAPSKISEELESFLNNLQ